MKLIIDIPTGMYEAYKGRPPMFGDEGLDNICQAIANGKPYDEKPQSNMKEILDVIHKTIYQFFDVCRDDEETPMSSKDILLWEVNKVICNNLERLQQKETENEDNR